MQKLVIRFIVALVAFSIGISISPVFVSPVPNEPNELSEKHNQAFVGTTPEELAPQETNAQERSDLSIVIEVSEPNPNLRAIDFANFTYEEFTNPRTLVNGKEQTDADPLYLASVIYGDVTGDNVEDALVVLFTSVRGTAIPYDGYVFTLRNGRPKLLWSFSTGDRAGGGLRQMYADNGELVVELYGKGTRIGGTLNGTEASACCPSSFTRNRYQWNRNRFRRKRNEEVLSNPAKHGSLIMPRYARSERAQ